MPVLAFRLPKRPEGTARDMAKPPERPNRGTPSSASRPEVQYVLVGSLIAAILLLILLSVAVPV